MEEVTVGAVGLARLQSAAQDFANAEVLRLTKTVIEDLRSHPAEGVFDEVGARHLWDEYCWSLQEGPFDMDMAISDYSLGNLSDSFDGLVRACITEEVEKLPRHALIFLSAQVFDDDESTDAQKNLGGIWINGIVNLVLEAVNEAASRRQLDLIGPNRSDAVGYEVEGTGLVWSALSERGEAMDLIAGHADALINGDADLRAFANELVDAYMTAAREAAEDNLFGEFLEQFEDHIKSLLREKDVVPALEEMRAGLIERLDG